MDTGSIFVDSIVAMKPKKLSFPPQEFLGSFVISNLPTILSKSRFGNEDDCEKSIPYKRSKMKPGGMGDMRYGMGDGGAYQSPALDYAQGAFTPVRLRMYSGQAYGHQPINLWNGVTRCRLSASTE